MENWISLINVMDILESTKNYLRRCVVKVKMTLRKLYVKLYPTVTSYYYLITN